MRKFMFLFILLFVGCMKVEMTTDRGGVKTMLVQGHHYEWAPLPYCKFFYTCDLEDLMKFADSQVKPDEVVICMSVDRDKTGIYATIQDDIIRAYCVVLKKKYYEQIKYHLLTTDPKEGVKQLISVK